MLVFVSAGTALVEQQSPNRSGRDEETDGKAAKSGPSNNRMPGNIVCGICGVVRYYSFVLQAKKFGTFSCEPCRKFISKMIKDVKNGLRNIDCVTKSGNIPFFLLF